MVFASLLVMTVTMIMPNEEMLHITIHRPEAYTAYEQRIADLQAQLKKREQDVYQMSLYAEQLLRALDELRHCQKLMKKAGLDTSFIRSLRR